MGRGKIASGERVSTELERKRERQTPSQTEEVILTQDSDINSSLMSCWPEGLPTFHICQPPLLSEPIP